MKRFKKDFIIWKIQSSLSFESDSSENHYNGKHYHQHHQEHEFKSILLTSDQDIKRFLFQLIDRLILTNQGSLYRFKGLIALQDQDFIVAIQGVNEQVNFQYTTRQKTKPLLF